MVRNPRGRVVLSLGVKLALPLLLFGCSAAYKAHVESRVALLPQEDARLYAKCVVKTCNYELSELAMQQIQQNAEMACLVDTDKGKTEAESTACRCSLALNADRQAACEKWVNYAPPTASGDAGVTREAKDGGSDAS